MSLFHCVIYPTNIYAQFSEVGSVKFVLDAVILITHCIHANVTNHYRCEEKQKTANVMGSGLLQCSGVESWKFCKDLLYC